ncbi:hypothetical protein KIH39_05145 [Telmatocola sphagniphila]|uniref:Uncharacterized protein n=1 Tax=Telmatocola sphagniphila TaxID=1123043 RepID=A0A8E6BA10_9BACT|nr:hypothetical protein [Telmatocola sphagniphila]QVL33303.1 hypothetical protein KIH39_05145 [Telmatocola sphagniphila]
MLKILLSILFITIAGPALAQEVVPPLKKAKIGDYVIFKMDSAGAKMSMRQEVTAVTDQEVTVTTTTTINGMQQKDLEQKFKLNEKYDPSAMAKNQKDAKIEATGKGEETLKIDGKSYKCSWQGNKVTVKNGDMEIVSESKVWISKDAPVFGLVKTETKVFGQTSTLILVESGSKK